MEKLKCLLDFLFFLSNSRHNVYQYSHVSVFNVNAASHQPLDRLLTCLQLTSLLNTETRLFWFREQPQSPNQ